MGDDVGNEVGIGVRDGGAKEVLAGEEVGVGEGVGEGAAVAVAVSMAKVGTTGSGTTSTRLQPTTNQIQPREVATTINLRIERSQSLNLLISQSQNP
jgi:hypothetical protein